MATGGTSTRCEGAWGLGWGACCMKLSGALQAHCRQHEARYSARNITTWHVIIVLGFC